MPMARQRSNENPGRRLRIELSTTGVVLWSGVLLFLLVWIFALGILVGRDSLPGEIRGVSELKEQMARLQDMVRREKGEEEDSGATPAETPKLAFYDTLATKKEEARERKSERPKVRPKTPSQGEAPLSELTAPPAGPGVVSRVPPESEGVGAPQKKETGVPKASEGVSENERGEEASVPLPDPVAAPKPADDLLLVKAQYTVQVASMESREAAEEMIARLNRKGYPSYYYDVTIRGKTYYRVRCGRFLSRAEAEDHAVLLAGKEGIKGFVSKLE